MSGRGRGRGRGGAKRARSEENDDDDSGKEGKEGKENADRDVGKALRLPLDVIKVGDIVSQTQYMRIERVTDDASGEAGKKAFEVLVLRSSKPVHEGEDIWTIRTMHPFQAASAAHYTRTEYLSKTELAKRFMDTGSHVFTVTFRPVASAENTGAQLKQLHSQIATASSDADFKSLAKSLLAFEPKTIRGRMLRPDSELGYSLIDDLGQPDSRKTSYRQGSPSYTHMCTNQSSLTICCPF